MRLKEKIRNIKGRKLIVSKTRIRGAYYVNSNKMYDKLLDEVQVRLIALDVSEKITQDLTLVLDTTYADMLKEDLKVMSEVIRFNIVVI